MTLYFKTIPQAVLVAVILLFGSGCTTLSATDNAEHQISADPFEGFNRSMHNFNSATDRAILRPVSNAYKNGLPRPVRKSVGRFFDNLGEPLNIVNNLLQGSVDRSLRSSYRFVVNSTIGVFGLFDPASTYGVRSAPEDFGQTLAAWGVKPGPYLVLPFWGPTNLRDGVGGIVDTAAYYPINELSDSDNSRFALLVLNVVDTRAQFIGPDAIVSRQLDPYLFTKITQEKNRINAIYNGAPPDSGDEDYDDF